MADRIRIPFNKPFIVGKELYYIAQSVISGHISGDGVFTKKCHALMEEDFGSPKVLLTTSCTSALEMAALLFGIGEGDEVIMPSFTFVSTANAFYLRGANIKFADIRHDTLNIDEDKIDALISDRTKAIVVVHYAGVSCEMDKIMDIAQKRGILVLEDAAQGIGAEYKGRHLGTIGDLGAYSFHETKNLICGEGGALSVNSSKYLERAEIIREKGTDRSKFFRGEVDKYTWVDAGSSYLPSDLLAAFLYAQLENIEKITERRKEIYNYYYSALKPLEVQGHLRLPVIPAHCKSNSHMFYMLLNDEKARDGLMAHLKSKGILAVFHYLPLHLSAVGRKMGYNDGALPITESASARLLRLPFYYELKEHEQEEVTVRIKEFFGA